LPEYYPTRTEIGILEHHGAEIADLLGRDLLLVEFGSGSNRKIRVLLEALRPAVYVPVDISRDHLLASARDLARRFPDLDVHAVCADYTSTFDLPMSTEDRNRAAFFPGSSIGNFDPVAARRFLGRVGSLLKPGGKLLIGVDLIKDRAVLDAAYNDARGVTAEFNLNLLRRINRELNADFDLDTFRHHAFFNEVESRVEMHLVSTRTQRVSMDGGRFGFDEEESIHTENSYKYSVPGFHALVGDAGFVAERVWTDPQRMFSVHGLRFEG
jgi:dimethylhistidine N-methyltransferase